MTNFEKITAIPEAMAQWITELIDDSELQCYQCPACLCDERRVHCEESFSAWLKQEAEE